MSNFVPTTWDDIKTAALNGPVGYAAGGGNTKEETAAPATVPAAVAPIVTPTESAKDEATRLALERVEADKERKRKGVAGTMAGTAAGVLNSAPIERKELLG